MKVFINFPQNWAKKYSNTDITYLAYLCNLPNYIPIELSWNRSLILPRTIPYLSRLKATRFHKYLPSFFSGRHIPINKSQLYDCDLFYTFWIRPIFWGVGKQIPNILRFHYTTLSFRQSIFPNQTEKEAYLIYHKELQTYLSGYHSFVLSTRRSLERFKQDFIDLGSKAHYIPFFLPHVNSVSEDFVKNKMMNKEQIRLLFVGRDGKRKGLFELLKAIASLNMQDRKNIHLTIITQTPFSTILLPDNTQIDWKPSVNNYEVLELMQQAHVFCLPTLSDSYGIVFIEAMANGCAILADNDEPRQEMVTDNDCGICVNPQDTPQLKKSLEYLINNREKVLQFGINAIKAFRENYSPQIVSQKYLSLFESLLKG